MSFETVIIGALIFVFFVLWLQSRNLENIIEAMEYQKEFNLIMKQNIDNANDNFQNIERIMGYLLERDEDESSSPPK